MALQGDGNGIVTIPNASAIGDFSVVFSGIMLVSDIQIVIGDNTATNNFIACFAGPDLTSRVFGNTLTKYSGTSGQTVKYEVKRDSGVISHLVNDVIVSSASEVGIFNLNTFFAYDNNALVGTMLLSGTCSMIGFSAPSGGTPARSYNLEGSGVTLVDTISGENGTLSGFTSGGFVTPSTGITITSVVDNECRQRNASNKASFTISGDITGIATSIEYQLDNGSWQTLDSSPSATYNGSVTVTNEQSISVRISDDIGSTATVQKLKAAACIVIAPAQSNAVSRIINAQTFSVSAGKPTPAMYKNGIFSALADPTGVDASAGQDGSLWPYIAKQYSDLGIPVCIGNVAEGGTAIDQWTKGASYYDRIAQFATSCGGLEFAISLIGETNSAIGTPTETFKSEFLSVANDINSDYGCNMYAVYFPVGTSTGTPSRVAAIRLAYDELIAENAFIKFGGDLSVIDISSAINPLNDNLHIKTDADATSASSIIWSALTSVVSTLNLVATGYPNGTYLAEFYQVASPLIHIKTENVTFSGGVSSTTIPLAASTTVYTRIDGATPPSTGVTCYGVTV